MMVKKRKARETRITISVNSNTLGMIDEVANSFEDYVSRGEVIDMMAEYIANDTRLMLMVFGELFEVEEEAKKGKRKKKG